MNKKFVEFTSTDNLKILINPNMVGAVEPVAGSQRVQGHVKIYSVGFKFLIQEELEDVLRKLSEASLVG
jgi:hypothetical protein